MWRAKIAGSLTGSGMDDLHLKGTLCRVCDRKYFPARKNCPTCLKEDTIESVRLSDYGTLYSFVNCGIAPPGYALPHVQCYIDLDDGGPRIFSLISDYGDAKRLTVGMRMVLSVGLHQKDSDGTVVAEYSFKPI